MQYNTAMQIHVITLFPDYFKPLIELSVVGRAHKQGIVSTNVVNLRDFGLGEYKQVDDRPFGGGAGMLLMVEPIEKALHSIGVKKGQENSKIILTSAKGTAYTQLQAREYSTLETLTIICGHYEGVDERVAQYLIDEEVRVGEFVLSGGEPAVTVIIDSVVRLLPGTLGNNESIVGESHDVPGQLAAPQYTRPAEYNSWKVPEVLTQGNHLEIKKWKQSQTKQSS